MGESTTGCEFAGSTGGRSPSGFWAGMLLNNGELADKPAVLTAAKDAPRSAAPNVRGVAETVAAVAPLNPGSTKGRFTSARRGSADRRLAN